MFENVRIGCCGFPVARNEYFENLGAVELQSTFYELPESSLVRKWRAEAPKGFEFTLRAWQLITHPPKSPTYEKLKTPVPPSKVQQYGFFRPTVEVFWAWERTRELAVALGAKVIIFHSPPGFVSSAGNKRNMEHFFTSVERRKLMLGWEAGPEWEASEVGAICRELNLMHVVDPFKSRVTTSGLRYYRLQGRSGIKYKYTVKDLATLKNLAAKFPNSYFMFGNIHMFKDTLDFREMLKEPERA